MAIITNIRKINKEIKANSSTIMDYNYDERYYSIWTYKSSDLNGDEGSKQNLQFSKETAEKLIKTLEEFINK